MTDSRGASSIGTLLLLIAMLLVALIAAGVVLYLADYLRNQIDQLPYLARSGAMMIASS
ncbi:hypothetical protein HKK80_06305 [Halonotius sp. F2-221B]|uniref:hypothetical protein n=1 Tax=Halonotius sp. F2-221B TaxID=2731620 RepID=UPI00398B1D66